MERIFNYLQKYIIVTIAIIVSVVTFYFLYHQNQELKLQLGRIESNQSILLEKKSSEQLQLNKDDIKKLIPNIDSITDKLNIKQRNITNIVTTNYKFKDTTIVSTKIINTPSGLKYFNLSNDCYSLYGRLYNDSLSVYDVSIDDKITTFLYKDYHKKFWFIKWKPYYNCKVFSKCKNDTISVTNNIKIIK